MNAMTIIGAGLNGLVILLMGWLGLSLLQRLTGAGDAFAGPGSRMMRWSVTWLLGMAMAAAAAQGWLVVKLLTPWPLWVVDVGVICLLVIAWRWFKARRGLEAGDAPAAAPQQLGDGVIGWLLHGWALVLGAAALGLAVMNYSRRVWGDWDAVMIWNARARFLDRAGSDWLLAFKLPVIHPDYPLFLPLSVMRGWQAMPGEHPLASMLVSLAFFVLAGTLLWATLAMGFGRRLASLGVIVLLSNILFLNYGSLQLADVPLAVCFMGSWAMIAMAMDRQSRNQPAALWWVLAGVMLSCTAWVKNEGLLMLLASGAGLLVTHHPQQWIGRASSPTVGRWRAGILVLAGAMPVGVMILGAKLLLAGSNDLVRHQTAAAAMLAKLTDVSRHATIAQSLAEQLRINPTLWGMAGVVALGLLCTTRRSWRFGAPLGLACAMLLTAAGYWLVYVLTHHDLPWHLQTSLSRLLVHFWPALVLWTMMQAGLLMRETR